MLASGPFIPCQKSISHLDLDQGFDDLDLVGAFDFDLHAATSF